MGKIRITFVSKRLFELPGFDERGCLGTDCKDVCCNGVCEVDKAAHDLMLQHREKIEALTGVPLESCIDGEFVDDPDYPGGAFADSAQGEDGYCRFHNPKGRGCVLYLLSFTQGMPRGIVPAICRLFPITWDKGRLFHYDELREPGYPPQACNICAGGRCSAKPVFETQRRELEDIFELDGETCAAQSAEERPPG